MRRLLRRLRWVLGRYGLWPRVHITKEDLRGGEVTITYASLFQPRRTERYALGPNVGDVELTSLMEPLPFGTPEWRHRLQLLAASAPWSL